MDEGARSAAPRIRDFIGENFLFGRDEALGDGDSFMESGILDSTGLLQLVAFLTEAFGVYVADEEMTPENLDSIDRVAAYVERKLNGVLPAGQQ